MYKSGKMFRQHSKWAAFYKYVTARHEDECNSPSVLSVAQVQFPATPPWQACSKKNKKYIAYNLWWMINGIM